MKSLRARNRGFKPVAREETGMRDAADVSGHQDSTAGVVGWIALRSIWLVLPMLLFTAVFVSLVYVYKVDGEVSPFPQFRIPGTEAESNAYYVQLSSTILIFISSWSSSLAPLLTGAAMYLMAFPVSKGVLDSARRRMPHTLFTPMQLSVTLQFLDGSSAGALWSWLLYLVRQRGRRESQSRFLLMPASIAVIMSTLSFVVFLIDTWLHVTTTTVNLVQIASVELPQDYSLTLRPACTVNNGSVAANIGLSGDICSMDFPGDHLPSLVYSNVSIQVLNNVSDSVAVFSDAPDSTLAYFGIPLGARDLTHDYTATTFAGRTECEPILGSCSLTATIPNSASFQCTDAWSGDPLDSGSENPPAPYVQTEFFTDESMSSNDTIKGIQNPFWHGIATVADITGSHYAQNLSADPDGFTDNGGVRMIFMCRTILYDVEYDLVNGSVTRFVLTPSNDTIANWFQSPLMKQAFIPSWYLSQSIQLAAVNAASIREMGHSLAQLYNKFILGVGSYTLRRSPEIRVQSRTTALVTRLPKAPFLCLIVANSLFVVFGVGLTFIALSNRSQDVLDVSKRLSINGLVVDRFGKHRSASLSSKMTKGRDDDILEEYGGMGSIKIGVDKMSDATFKYQVWPRIVNEELRPRTAPRVVALRENSLQAGEN